MKSHIAAAAIAMILLSACCPMVSIHPLSAPVEADQRLFGVWSPDAEDGERVFLHVGRDSTTGMVALSVEHHSGGKLDTVRFPFFITKTKTNQYLNVRLEDVDRDMAKGNEGYLFLKYDFDDENTLRIYHLDRESIIAAIQVNRLKGQITYKPAVGPAGSTPDTDPAEDSVDCVLITENSVNMLNFLEAGDDGALFLDAMTLKRQK